MRASNTINLVIMADPAMANQAIGSVNQALGVMGAAATGAGERGSSAMVRLEQTAGRAAVTIENRFSALKGVLGANLIQGLVSQLQGVTQAGLQIAGTFQSARIGLEAFLGSGDKATVFFNDLQRFAAEDPFEFKDLLTGANRLLAFDIAGKDVIKTLESVSATVGALANNDIGKFNDFITALGQIRQAGRLTGEEIRQLRNIGIPVLDFLTQAYRKTVPEIQKAVSDGLVAGTDAVEIIVDQSLKKFGAFRAQVAKTLTVALSGVRDQLNASADALLGPVLGKLAMGVMGIKSALVVLEPDLKRLGVFLAENAEGFGTAAKYAAQFAGVIGAGLLVNGIKALTVSLVGLSVAAASNPWVAITAGVVGFGVVLGKLKNDQNQYLIATEEKFVRGLAAQGKSVEQIVAAMKAANEEQFKLQQRFGDQVPTEALQLMEASAARVQAILNPPKSTSVEDQLKAQVKAAMESADAQLKVYEFQKKAGDDAKKRLDAEKSARELLLKARFEAANVLKDEESALRKIEFELAKNLQQYGLTKKAIQEIGQASAIAAETELRRITGKRFEARQQAERERQSAVDRARLDAEADTLRLGLELRREAFDREQGFEFERLAISRDKQLSEAESLNARTVMQKIAVEQRKAEIESEFLIATATLRLSQLDQQTQREIAKYESMARAKLITEQAFALQRDALLRASSVEALQVEEQALAQIELRRQKASNDSARMISENTERTFATMKRSVEGVFDQLVTRAKSPMEAIGAILKTALMSAIKEVVTSRIALALTEMFSGNRASAGVGVQAGGLGMGALWRFAGLGGITAAGLPLAGAPGGTGGFAGPVSAANLGMGGYGWSPQVIGANGQPLSGGMGLAGQVGMLASAKGMLAQLGQIGATNKAFSSGVYGAKGGAMLAGGGILVADGLRRGGLMGTLETAAGGALIGAKFGGPIGAAIGAAAGLAAGLIRNMFKSANEKVREKIKSIYGVDITSKDILGQVVSIAKQSYGGNLDVAIRSKDVQDLVELYAMSTGQSASGLAARMQPVTLSTSGGVTGILANYVNGKPVSMGGTQAPGPTVIQVTLDGESSAAFLQGQTVQAIESNPRAVAAATDAAQQSNFNRQQSAVNQFSPGLLLA
jgi:tape measure domain-containing protein